VYKVPIDRIPQKGYVLAYFRSELLFEPYEVCSGELSFERSELLEKEEARQLHFFDEKEEYRMVRRTSRNEVIELHFSGEEEAAMDPDLIFAEDVLLEDEYANDPKYPEKIRIINRYYYSENDTIVLKNYRIMLIR